MDKLSSEVAQALAAGMSYGKWKAMQTPVVIEPKEEPEKVKCRNCGAVLEQKDNRSRFYCDAYCGHQYRDRLYQQQKRMEAKVDKKECEICGEEYTPIKVNQKYCCRECTYEALKKRMRERTAIRRAQEGTMIKCAECGNEFEPLQNRQKYCGDDCRASANRRQCRERYIPKKEKANGKA